MRAKHAFSPSKGYLVFCVSLACALDIKRETAVAYIDHVLVHVNIFALVSYGYFKLQTRAKLPLVLIYFFLEPFRQLVFSPK